MVCQSVAMSTTCQWRAAASSRPCCSDARTGFAERRRYHRLRLYEEGPAAGNWLRPCARILETVVTFRDHFDMATVDADTALPRVAMITARQKVRYQRA